MRRLACAAALLLAACGSNNAVGDDGGDDIGDDAGAIDSAPPDSPAPQCAQGDTEGTANGVDVCLGPTGIPRFQHIFVIVMENTSYDTLANSDNTPYIHSLMAAGAVLTNYHGVEHPSLPNYIAMASGDITDNGTLDCDCDPTGSACGTLNCNFVTSTCGCPQAQSNIAEQLDAAGITWKSYAEDMGTPCNLTAAGDYDPKHVPFLYFPTLTDDASQCNTHVVDYGSFAGDLAQAPRFTFITPNMVHDMHNPIPSGASNLANGDTWLAQEVPAILASQAFLDRGLLVIVWDEDDNSGIPNADDPIPFIAVSPLLAPKTSDTHFDHYDLLATFEDAYGVPRLGSAGTATPMAELFTP